MMAGAARGGKEEEEEMKAKKENWIVFSFSLFHFLHPS